MGRESKKPNFWEFVREFEGREEREISRETKVYSLITKGFLGETK